VKAVIYHAYDDIRLEQRAIPVINDHELLVRVHGCGLCGSDIIKIVQQIPPPVILGHELTGTITQCGQQVTAFAEGERVVVAHHVPCGACHYCLHQNYSMCATFKASNIDPGGLAEYIRVPVEHVQHVTLPLPETLSAEEGSFTEPLACCVRAVRRTPLLDGDTVVVMGLGSIGLLMLQAFKALNARAGRAIQVYGIDLIPERLQLARDLGAHDAFPAPANEQALRDLLRPYTAGRGADCIMLTVGGVHAFQQGIAGVRKGGLLHLFAAHTGSAPMNIEAIYQEELSIISTYSSSPEDLRVALDLISSGEVQVKGLISHRLPLELFQQGVTLMRERAALKVYFQIAGEIHGK